MTAAAFIPKFRSYLDDWYDGEPREFSAAQEAAFDEAFHDDLQFVSFGNSSSQTLSGGRIRTKADRKQDEAKFAKLGTIAKLSDDSFQVIDDQHLRVKCYFKNEKVEASRDYLVTVKDGRALVFEPYNEASALKPVLRKYIATYDGTKTDFSEMEPILAAAFHDNLQQVAGDQIRSKEDFNEAVKSFLAMGTKFTEQEIRVLDESHLEMKVHVKNEKIDLVENSLVTIKDGKIIKLEPFNG